ncbi:MAG: AmmeMemoRadiSam system radical SAM enzyme [Polyangiaceae bacterium]|nr:AmmeMemoRadiSam system radical SAM enzyme [Polyangiaceae bacterium]
MTSTLGEGYVRGRWQHALDDGRIQCDLCPRLCRLHDGQRAFCFVRERVGDAIYLSSYGRATGFCIDPIEKKPLHHFYPGTSVLSFGTAGCNLGCKFCQNWDISKAKEIEKLSDRASPAEVAETAKREGCKSVAFTYNDPVIFAEYAIDCANECRARGIETVAVTAGYITPEARRDFFSVMSAANVDLKAFDPEFYRKLCNAELAPVLDTLTWLRHETDVWIEVTTLLIPGHNDSVEEVDRLCTWFVKELGPDVPLHFSAFHPDFKLLDVPPTPPATCQRAREQALAHGIRYVYSGNIHDVAGGSTCCPRCHALLIERDWYELLAYRLKGSHCGECGAEIAGRFSAEGALNAWGRRRQRVVIR